MAKTSDVQAKQVERARGDGEGDQRLSIGVSKEFLQWINVESAKRGLSNRDFVIQALLRAGQEEF